MQKHSFIHQNVHEKKVLALVLAFACAFTMFAGAAFTDQADISQTEAVDMLTALGVIDGYEDGSFQPDATISRAEAAKMIYTIWNGGNDDASAFEGTSNFTDVYSGHWAEGYINFCYTNGIVAGKSTTTFDPNADVTGTELAKMLLICMGYQSDRSGLEGSAWAQNTNALASQNGLYVDVATSVSTAMPRQYAAQIMYNALGADTVQWSADANAYEKVSSTGLELRPTGNNNYQWVNVTKNETLGKKCMGLDTIEDLLLTAVKQENGRSTYSLDVYGAESFTRVATDYSDLIGMNVNVMIKNDDRSQVYGVYADEDSSIIAEGVAGKLELNSNASDKKIKLDGTSYDLDQSVATTQVYNVNDDTAVRDLDDFMSETNNDAWTVKLIDTDGDGDANHAFVAQVNIGEVTFVNNSIIRVDVAGGSNEEYELDSDNIYADVARDDWVVIVDDDFTVDGNFQITKADVLTGSVQSVRDTSKEIRMDGTWYKAADSFTDSLPAVGSNIDLVVYGGMFFDVSGASSSVDVAVVTGVGNYDRMDGIVEVRLMFRDGSEEVVDVENWNGITNTSTPTNLESALNGGSLNPDVLVAYAAPKVQLDRG